jgi:hypothetical protein
VSEYLHSSELRIDSGLDLEAISEEYVALLCEDRENKLVIVLETVREVFESHDGVFYLLPEKCLLKEVVELDLIELTDDEYIDDIVRGLVAEVEDPLRDRDEIKGLASLEEVLDRPHDIICLQEHLTELIVDRTGMIHLIVFFLILLV